MAEKIKLQKIIEELKTNDYEFFIGADSSFRVLKQEEEYTFNNIDEVISFLFRLKNPKSVDKYSKAKIEYFKALEAFIGGLYETTK